MPRWRRDFHFVWAGESVSLFGTQVTQLALPLTAVTTLHAGPGQLGLLGTAEYLPFLILGIPAGVLVDRRRRRPVLVASNLVQAGAIGTVPVLAALGQLTFTLLCAGALAAGAGRAFFLVAYRSYLPAVVPTSHLTFANSRLSASESAAEIGGPGIGGVLVQAFGAPYALLLDAVSYVASALGLGAVRQREPVPTPDTTALRTQIAEGFRFTFANPYLRAFAGEAASYNLCWQVVQTVLVLFAVQRLHLSAALLGLVLSVGAVGALLGAVFTGRVADRIGLGRTLVGAAVIGDLAPLVLPVTPPGRAAVILLGAAFFVRGIGITGCNVHTMAIRQTITPDRLRGRTNAAYLLLVYGVVPVGALAGGWLGDTAGLRTTLLIGTLGLLSTALFLIFSPVRRVHRLVNLTTPATSDHADMPGNSAQHAH